MLRIAAGAPSWRFVFRGCLASHGEAVGGFRGATLSWRGWHSSWERRRAFAFGRGDPNLHGMDKPRVALFVTCLVDLYRPAVGFAAIRLIEAAGCTVEVPVSQTCCGQPAYNSGDRRTAQDLARPVIDAFLSFDYVVAPSGSCAGMISHHYPALFQDTDPHYRGKAEALAAKTFELTAFLADVRGMTGVSATYNGIAAYHDSCS
jgi:L-lactate dehydrogenase complex protein LldE